MKLSFVEVAGFRGFRDKTRFEIPAGFAVFVGRNGVGKSTVFDAVDFVLTGTINKFDVVNAKGGGLEDHIWWVGDGTAPEHYVSVGFVDDQGKEHVFRRDRAGAFADPGEIAGILCLAEGPEKPSVETLMETSLIRDERIVALSLDLPEQKRFAAVRTGIAGAVGGDHSERTGTLLRVAISLRDELQRKVDAAQAEYGRSLTALTEARSVAEKSTDIAEALRILESLNVGAPASEVDRAQLVRSRIADRRQALTELEAARERALAILPTRTYLNSEDAKRARADLRRRQEAADGELELSKAALDAAMQARQAESDADIFAAHMSALIDHGQAVGLLDGHCPLCDAARSDQQFQAALAKARARLAEQGERLQAVEAAVAAAEVRFENASAASIAIEAESADAIFNEMHIEEALSSVQATYESHGLAASAESPEEAQLLILKERDDLVRLERALFILEASGAMERVKSFESRSANLKSAAEQETAKLATAENAVNLARQIDSAAKMVENEFLAEQFDTVMPLLKELYARLRPHAGWTEIESDFGGKVRASLNFKVGDGHNVQFLFSSGQRRAFGLAFLLAVHLSRRWCGWKTLMLDDPVQHIDDYRALNLVEVLSAVRRTGRQVLVAIEDQALADVLCRRLRSIPDQHGRCFTLSTSAGAGQISGIRDIFPMPKEILRTVPA